MARRTTLAILLLTAAVASACGGTDGGANSGLDSGAVTSLSATTTAAPVAPTAPASSTPPASSTTVAPPMAGAPLSSSSRLRIDGIGPIEVGMTVAQARAAAGTELSLKNEPYCDVLTPTQGPEGVALIVTSPSAGRVELIIVNGGPVSTVSGIRVGSAEAEVIAAYPGRLRSVNPSLPVHRLIYQASDPALADRILVFVIGDSRVATMYAGVRDQAEADEICG